MPSLFCAMPSAGAAGPCWRRRRCASRPCRTRRRRAARRTPGACWSRPLAASPTPVPLSCDGRVLDALGRREAQRVDEARRLEGRADQAPRDRRAGAPSSCLAEGDPGVARVVLDVDVGRVGVAAGVALEVGQRQIRGAARCRVEQAPRVDVRRARRRPPRPRRPRAVPSAEIATSGSRCRSPASAAGSTSSAAPSSAKVVAVRSRRAARTSPPAVQTM